MLRTIITAAAFSLAATSGQAFDIENMTDEERAIFQSEIRAYLLENPHVIMEAVQILQSQQNQQAAAAELALLRDNSEEIYNDGVSFVGGNPDGDVTIVEFLDYRCGYCKRAFPSVEELLASDGNIRFVVKEFPILGEASVMVSQYALAVKFSAGDDAYKTVHDKLMLHRGDINEGYLARLSREIGVDHGDVADLMESQEVMDVIAANRQLAQKLAIQGTPSFIMGENFVRGFVELDQMRAIVEGIRNEQS